MRIYDREGFMRLPEGTIYTKAGECGFGKLLVKMGTISLEPYNQYVDWAYIDPLDIDANDPDKWDERYDLMKNEGASFPMNMATSRDGMFDESELFLVLDCEDLEKLGNMIEAAKSVA